MNRSFATRSFALLTALLVLFSGTGEVLGAHACPHHGHLGVSEATGHGAAAEDAGDGRDLAAQPAGSSAPAGHEGPCTCAGPCHGNAPEVSTGVPSQRSAGLFSVRRAVGYIVVRHARLSFLPFFHPYANAPPPGV